VPSFAEAAPEAYRGEANRPRAWMELSHPDHAQHPSVVRTRRTVLAAISVPAADPKDPSSRQEGLFHHRIHPNHHPLARVNSFSVEPYCYYFMAESGTTDPRCIPLNWYLKI
jgi:hypothetical protein